MPFTKTYCQQCGKVAEGEKSFDMGDSVVWLLKCGHMLNETGLNSSRPEDIRSTDGKRLYPFQCDGVRFVEKSGGRCLLGDEMGLGKTVQGLAALMLHYKEMCPFLWVGKSSLKYQYQHETMRWGGEDWFAQVIDSSKAVLLPGCMGYIISYDLLRRMNGSFLEQVEKKIKTIVLDECQQIKNSESARTKYTRLLCSKVPNVIALSGTPIKNHAAEYFPILNILKPEIFPREANFIRNECDSYWNGYSWKTGGLANPEKFKAKTRTFIIRRERAEVLPDLPKIDRQFQFHEMSAAVEQAYIDTFKKFRAEYNNTPLSEKGSEKGFSFDDATNIMAYLSRMRHLVGLSKIDPCIDHVMEFLGSTERKLTIFVHHKDVGEILREKLNLILKELGLQPVIQLTAELDAEQRFNCVQKFINDSQSRILVASTLASGEGLNLQICSDCILLERQWNPANEEQAEARFPRPGSTAQSITATYFVAVGTVDEFFSEIVERKREIVNSTLSGEAAPTWDQSSLMKELSSILATNGGKKWSI
jgi:SWI/SNF-related matrix-associated actin-dependent regulator 1 of chromatin subfamily A